MNSTITIGQRIRDLRGDHKQEDLADALEVDRSLISKWESGKSNISIDALLKLSEYFKVPTDYVLRGVQPKIINIHLKTRLSGDAIDGIEKMARSYPKAHKALDYLLSNHNGIWIICAVAEYLQSPEESRDYLTFSDETYSISRRKRVDPSVPKGKQIIYNGINAAKISRYILLDEIAENLRVLRTLYQGSINRR